MNGLPGKSPRLRTTLATFAALATSATALIADTYTYTGYHNRPQRHGDGRESVGVRHRTSAILLGDTSGTANTGITANSANLTGPD